jgi:trigger factor
MTVVTSIDTIGPCRKKLQIEVPAIEVDAETARVVREYGRRVRLPGFRKGKVPAAVVEKRFRSEIEREVLDRLVPRFWQQAREESELEPLLPPSVGEIELHAGQPLVFEATVDVRPLIELDELTDFDLPKEDAEPGEQAVDDALARLQMQAAELVEVDRAVVRGDIVKLELLELDDEGEERRRQEIEVEVGGEGVWEELTLALTGLKPQQEAEFQRHEEHGDHSHEHRFKATVGTVRERDIQPLDDDLAQKVGDFASLDQLREEVTERLRADKKREIGRRREQALLDQLRDRHPLGLPEGVVEEEVRELLGEYAQGLARQGVDVQKAEIDWQSLGREVRPQAEKRVHVRLLLDAVASRLGIEVESSEVEERIAVLARAQGASTSAVRRTIEQRGHLESLRSQLLHEKTIATLLEDDDSAPAAESDADSATDGD